MNANTVYSKTAKGLLELKNKSKKLNKDQFQVLGLVDGHAGLDEIASKAKKLGRDQVDAALQMLEEAGLVRSVVMTQDEPMEELDFTGTPLNEPSEWDMGEWEKAAQRQNKADAQAEARPDQLQANQDALKAAQRMAEAQQEAIQPAQSGAKRALAPLVDAEEDRLRLEREEAAAAKAARAQAEADERARLEEEVRRQFAEEEQRRKDKAERIRREEEERERALRDAENAAQRAAREAEEARQRAEREAEEARLRAEREAEEARQREEDARRLAEEERQLREEEERLRILLEERQAEERRVAEEQRLLREEQERMRREALELQRQKEEEKRRQEEEERKYREELERIAREQAERIAKEQAERRRQEKEAREAEERRQREEERLRREQEAAERAALEAEEKARMEAERRMRDLEEQAIREEERRRAKEEAEVMAKVRQAEEDARQVAEALAARKAGRRRRSKKLLLVMAPLLVIGLLLGLLHVIPFNFAKGGVEQDLSAALGEPVTISQMRYSLLPRSQITLQGVKVGALEVPEVKASVSPAVLVGGAANPSAVTVVGLPVTADTAGRLPGLLGKLAQRQAGPIRELRLTGLAPQVPDWTLPAVDALVKLGEDGRIEEVRVLGLGGAKGSAKGSLKPQGAAWVFDLAFEDWQPPLGPAVTYNVLSLKGTIDASALKVTELNGRALGGVFKGNSTLSWAGTWGWSGQIQAERLEFKPLMDALGSPLDGKGAVALNGQFASRGAHAKAALAATTVSGDFHATEGIVKQFDLITALQKGSARDGETAFDALSGRFSSSAAGAQLQLRDLKLNAGQLRASGSLDAVAGQWNGRLAVDFGGQSVRIKGNVDVAGAADRPQLTLAAP